MWFVSVYDRYMYLLEHTLEPPKKFQYLTRADEIVRLQIGHIKATKSHILSRTIRYHFRQILTIGHMLLDCTALQEHLDKLINHFSEFLREGLFYLIPTTKIRYNSFKFYSQLTKFCTWVSAYNITIPSDSVIWPEEHVSLNAIQYIWVAFLWIMKMF